MKWDTARKLSVETACQMSLLPQSLQSCALPAPHIISHSISTAYYERPLHVAWHTFLSSHWIWLHITDTCSYWQGRHACTWSCTWRAVSFVTLDDKKYNQMYAKSETSLLLHLDASHWLDKEASCGVVKKHQDTTKRPMGKKGFMHAGPPRLDGTLRGAYITYSTSWPFTHTTDTKAIFLVIMHTSANTTTLH